MSKTDFQFRFAIQSDAAQLAEFAERTFRHTFAAENEPQDLEDYLATAFGLSIQAKELADSSTATGIMFHGETLVGYFQLVFNSSEVSVLDKNSAELKRLYVDARFHGQGIAHQLMQHAVAKVKSCGCKTLWLGVWEKNFRALGFYKKCGFSEVGSHIFQLGADAQRDLIMTKNLE